MERKVSAQRLRHLGVDASRILDITFPVRSVLGILIHSQYKETLTGLLTSSEIELLADFDQLDPAHIEALLSRTVPRFRLTP